MAMNDEETVALIAGGHTLGKTHGAGPAENVGAEPEGADVLEQGLGWKNAFGTGKGADTITSGLEGIWTTTPTQWSSNYFENLFGYEWELFESPAGAKQWRPVGGGGDGTVPRAHGGGTTHPTMLTTDLALRFDPAYAVISKRFLEDPKALDEAFARAWFKLTHRDMGPYVRGLGALVPAEPQIWQDPVPAVTHQLVSQEEVTTLKSALLTSGLSIGQLVNTAWASASTFRGTDKRGGANGARIALAPQKDWAVNEPEQLAYNLTILKGIQRAFNESHSATQISLADLIVLGGCAAIEEAAQRAGSNITVPFEPGRTDATAEMTDPASFAVLEPLSDGFRNFLSGTRPGEFELIERACLLTLTAPEMTVLIGGLRVLNANTGQSEHGVFTQRPETLTTDFFVNLLDMTTSWRRGSDGIFEGLDEAGDIRWTATINDLVFGSNSQLRAIVEVYASSDGEEKFIRDFVAAWDKVMNLDRFDLI
jgi:catalase-peroxidase